MSRQPPTSLEPERFASATKPLPLATTLPSDAFTSPALYELETEKILAREWLCAGRADQIPETGDYFTLDLLDEKLVIVRERPDSIRVLSRVCRHRAAEVANGAGNVRSFQCPYHAWTYGLDGQLRGAPYMDQVDGFDRTRCRLPEVRSELWEGWIFVNLDPDAAPLGPQLASLSKLFQRYRMSEMVAVETAVFDSPFNWKVLVDNFMEAYHHLAIHRDTLQSTFPAAASHTPDNDGPYAALFMPAKEGATTPIPALPAFGKLEEHERGRLNAAVVFPFHLFSPAAESLTWYHVLPESHDRFTLRIYSCLPKESLERPDLGEAIQRLQGMTSVIHHQDIEACETVWRGLHSRSFDTGRLSALEKPIWQFNQWWIERMVRDT